MKHSEHINDLAAALAKAQGLFTAAEREHIAKVQSKKGEGSSYQYAYADLQAYLDVCRGPLAENGLSFYQDVCVDGQRATVTTVLIHSSGQFIESSPLTLTAADAMPQSIGSAITYCRRYSLSAALGMASEADDDANGAQGNRADTGRKESNLPVCPQCKTNKSVIAGKAEYGGGFVCFAKKGGCGQKWQEDDEGTQWPSSQAAKQPPAEPIDPERRARDDAWVADCTGEIARAADMPALLEIAATIAKQNGYVRDKIRPVYVAKNNVLKSQEPATAGV